MHIRILLFALAVCLAAVFLPQSGQAASVQEAYNDARAQLDALAKDEKRARYREPWVRLADTFNSLYEKNPDWPLRPAALYRSARTYEGLAKRSFNPADAAEAIKRYESVTAHFPRSPLADDAIFCVARIQEESLKDPAAAQQTLRRLIKNYPKGDMAPKAKTKLAQLEKLSPLQKKTPQRPPESPPKQPAPGRIEKQAPPPPAPKQHVAPKPSGKAKATLIRVICAPDSQYVSITLETDMPVSWVVHSKAAAANAPARIVAEFPGTTLRSGIPAQQKASGLLKSFTIGATPAGATRVTLELSRLARFQVSPGNTPETLVIEAASREGRLPEGKAAGATVRPPKRGTSAMAGDLAMQLGLSVRTIVLDAGHGGSDPGAIGNGLIEKQVTLDMTKRVASRLQKKGFRVRTVRDTDVRVSLRDRTKFANKVKGDLFLSIHVNANTTPDISGVETYYLNFASSKAASRVAAVENAVEDHNLGSLEEMLANIMLGARTQESKRLAYNVQESMLAALKKKRFVVVDGGVRSAPLYVLMRSGMPGVLVEIGYCSNSTEARRLHRKDYRDILAEGIAEGVKNYAIGLSKR